MRLRYEEVSHAVPFSLWVTGGAMTTKACAQDAYETKLLIASFCKCGLSWGVLQ